MKDILNKVNRNDGFKVPDGYFEDFASRMADRLPKQPWETGAADRSGDEKSFGVAPRGFWQKVRPYIYLAAMFMGVWCMMKMFDLMRSDSYGLSIENNPVITAALGNDHFINDYFINEGDVNDYDLMNDLYETGFNPSEADLTDEEAYELLRYDADDADTAASIPENPEFPIL